jgi:uncharacterized protein (DUF1697 family)
MERYISLLRGINVGGHGRLPMDDLKQIYAGLGFAHVRTLLQSGNAVFDTAPTAPATLAGRIEESIAQRMGFGPRVIVLYPAQLAEALAHNPYPNEAVAAPDRLLLSFLDADPNAHAEAKLREQSRGPERFSLRGRTLYTYYPEGVGRSKLTLSLLERTLGCQGTARNWNTLQKLATLCNAPLGQ